MDKNKCDVARDLMPLVADGVASEGSKTYVDEHVAECEGCKGYFEGMTAQLLRAEQPEDTSAFEKLAVKMKRRLLIKRAIFALLAVFVLGIGGIMVWNEFFEGVEYLSPEALDMKLYRDIDDTLILDVTANEGYGFAYIDIFNYNGEKNNAMVYISAYRSKSPFAGDDGHEHWIEETELVWEDGGLYIYELHWRDGEYTEERSKVLAVRQGDRTDYKELYRDGDTIPER